MRNPYLASTFQRRTGVIVVVAVALFIVGACDRFTQRQAAEPSETEVAEVVSANAATAVPPDGEATGVPSSNAAQPTTGTNNAIAGDAAEPDAPADMPLPTATPEPTPPSGTITLWHSWAQRDGDALQAILESFHERYPSIQVETLFVAQDDLLQSYARAVTEGNGPDVVLAPNWWLNDLHALGVVAPLDGGAFGEIVDGAFPAAVDNLRIDGRPYGLPTNYETVALYVNRDLAPNNAPPASLDELVALAGQDPQYGVGIYANPFHIAWGFSAFGATLFDSSGRAVLDQSPGAADFLRWLASVDSLTGSYVDKDYGMLIDRFKRGEYAFFVDGPWALPELSEAIGDSLGVAAIPPGPAGASRPWLYADAAYVRPELPQQQQEVVAAFLSHLISHDSAEKLAGIAGRLPAARTANLSAYPGLNGFAAQAAVAGGMRHGPEMDAFWRYGGDMILRAVAGAEDLDRVIAETAALTNETTGY